MKTRSDWSALVQHLETCMLREYQRHRAQTTHYASILSLLSGILAGSMNAGLEHSRSSLVLGISICFTRVFLKCYALINRARGPYEEIFVLIFKTYGPNALRSMRLECQNKYFPYGPKSRLIRALLYTYTNKIVYDEILQPFSKR